MPNEKPILFSTPMVQAILREVNPKTMTRRVIKPQPIEFDEVYRAPNGVVYDGDAFRHMVVQAPYRPGDILWVRETIYYSIEHDNFYYKADQHGVGQRIYDLFVSRGCRGKKVIPTIHMPREAARIFLRVLAVQPERVQEISKGEAMMEGIDFAQDDQDGKEQFAALWDSINAARGYGWDANPWVWAITFERCKKPMGWPGN